MDAFPYYFQQDAMSSVITPIIFVRWLVGLVVISRKFQLRFRWNLSQACLASMSDFTVNFWEVKVKVQGHLVLSIQSAYLRQHSAESAIVEPLHLQLKTYKLQAACYNTWNLQPITAYRPIDDISLLTKRAPDDRHHGRGAAHFLATFNIYCSCLLHVVTCCLQVLSFNYYRDRDRVIMFCDRLCRPDFMLYLGWVLWLV